MVRFGDEWLEGEEFKAHIEATLEGCSAEGRESLLAEAVEAYRSLDSEGRSLMFESERRHMAERKANPPKRLAPGELRKNMERLLHRWESGAHEYEIYYSGGPEQLRRDLENGKYDDN